MFNNTRIAYPDQQNFIGYDEILSIEPKLEGCGCNKGMSGLGEVTGQDAYKIALTHFETLPATSYVAIASSMIAGNFDPIAREVAAAAEKICTAGIFDKAEDTIKNHWGTIAVAGGAALILILLLKK